MGRRHNKLLVDDGAHAVAHLRALPFPDPGMLKGRVSRDWVNKNNYLGLKIKGQKRFREDSGENRNSR